MHTPAEFGCKDAAKVVEVLYASGVWRHCLHCAGRAPKFTCSVCHKAQDDTQFGALRRYDYMSHGNHALRCNTCLRCPRCQKLLMSERDFSTRTEFKHLCIGCETFQCSCCQEQRRRREFVKFEDTKNFMRDVNQHRLLCQVCADKGYTVKDMKGYTCTACDHTYGRNKFTKSEMDMWNRSKDALHQHKVTCTACHARLAVLQKRVKKSKNRCRCGQPIHKMKCPMNPETRRKHHWWPGADLGTEAVTWCDKVFLDKVSPTWWKQEKALPNAWIDPQPR